MAAPPVTLQPAAGDDLEYVERLLDAAGLPDDDIRTTPGRFYVGTHEGTPVGIGGLERYGRDGLLRSVVVERSKRRRGLGTALCAALEAAAADAGIRTLYLLTTTAAGFFASRGYVEIDRAAAPAALQRTTQFADACPDSATCMTKTL